MVEAVAEAVHNLAPDIDVDEIIPVAVEGGSVAIEFQTPTHTSAALGRLTRKPVDGTAPKLRSFARANKAEVFVAGPRSDWKAVEFEDPDRSVVPRIKATSSYVAFVEGVFGSSDPQVRLKLPNDESFTAHAEEDLVRRVAPFLFTEIRAKLAMELDARTGRVLSRTLVGFEPFELQEVARPVFPPKPIEGLGFDTVAAFLAERAAS